MKTNLIFSLDNILNMFKNEIGEKLTVESAPQKAYPILPEGWSRFLRKFRIEENMYGLMAIVFDKNNLLDSCAYCGLHPNNPGKVTRLEVFRWLHWRNYSLYTRGDGWPFNFINISPRFRDILGETSLKIKKFIRYGTNVHKSIAQMNLPSSYPERFEKLLGL